MRARNAFPCALFEVQTQNAGWAKERIGIAGAGGDRLASVTGIWTHRPVRAALPNLQAGTGQTPHNP